MDLSFSAGTLREGALLSHTVQGTRQVGSPGPAPWAAFTEQGESSATDSRQPVGAGRWEGLPPWQQTLGPSCVLLNIIAASYLHSSSFKNIYF